MCLWPVLCLVALQAACEKVACRCLELALPLLTGGHGRAAELYAAMETYPPEEEGGGRAGACGHPFGPPLLAHPCWPALVGADSGPHSYPYVRGLNRLLSLRSLLPAVVLLQQGDDAAQRRATEWPTDSRLDNPTFGPGDAIEAKWAGTELWFPGTVAAVVSPRSMQRLRNDCATTCAWGRVTIPCMDLWPPPPPQTERRNSRRRRRRRRAVVRSPVCRRRLR